MSGSPSVVFGDFFSHLSLEILVLFSLFAGMLGDCGPPPEVKNAKLYDPIKSNYKDHESVVYICLPGYKEKNPDKSYIAICHPGTGWNRIEEFCEGGCQGAHETRFSVVDDEFLDFYLVGSVVHHVCHRSAVHIPGTPKRPAITCLSNYSWSAVPVFCIGQSCGDPGTPENGDRVVLMDFLLKAYVNFTCNEGYQLIGSPRSRCLPRGIHDNTVAWKPKPPICFRPTCPPPPEIKNGDHTSGKSGTFPLNSTVTYICNPGFSLSGHDSLHCITEDMKTGIWRGSVPECKGACPSPVLPPHSSLRGGEELLETYDVEIVLQLQCISGYEYIPGIKTPTMKCLDTSKWSDLPTLCQGKRCPIPHFENGKVVSSVDLRLGEEITLGCDYGFRIIGGTTRRCVLKSGTVVWDRELPVCERIPCVRPPEIDNGRYDRDPSDVYDAGMTVTYRCDAEFTLIGQSSITCTVAENGVDGKWDLLPPECKKVKCHRPTIHNGGVATVYQATYTYQNKIPIECNSGYTLVGSSLIECGSDSLWKPSIPKCVKLPTTSKPTKSPTPAVTPTPPMTPRHETVSSKEDGTKAAPTTAPTDESGSGHIVGIAIGAVIAVIVLAALIFAAVRWYYLQGKRIPHTVPPESYRVVSKTDVPLEEKKAKS